MIPRTPQAILAVICLLAVRRYPLDSHPRGAPSRGPFRGASARGRAHPLPHFWQSARSRDLHTVLVRAVHRDRALRPRAALLPDALAKAGFDTELVAFRENEDKEWDVREIIQRMACFLKDRWNMTQPTNMYRSEGKAIDLYTSESTRPEFRKLYGVIRDVVTMPEFIQSQFSQDDLVKGKRFGGLRAVKTLKKDYTRPGTNYQTEHLMDLAASLLIAAAFRELLDLRGDRYHWRVDGKDVFKRCAEDLYRILASKSRTAKSVTSLGSDTELWTHAVNIVLRTKDEVLAEGHRKV
jgi:hypothetical protein